MKRRAFLELLGKFVVFAVPLASKFAEAMNNREDGLSDDRFVLIVDSASDSVERADILMNAEQYLQSLDGNWLAKLEVWELQADEEKIKRFVARHGRNTKSFHTPILVRVPGSVEETIEVETWTPGWLANREKGKCYPISGGWWSVDGDWNPSIEKVRNHLYKSPNHSDGKFDDGWLGILIFDELQSLHSDHHREMTGKGKVSWSKVNKCAL